MAEKAYKVNFHYKDGGPYYHANIAYASSAKDIEDHYKAKTDWLSIDEASDSEVRTAELKGMPIIHVKKEKLEKNKTSYKIPKQKELNRRSRM